MLDISAEWDWKIYQHFVFFGKGTDSLKQHPDIFRFDPGKILVSARNAGISGPALMDGMLNKFNIQLEMAMGDYALAMTSIADTEEGFGRLEAALLEIDRSLTSVPGPPSPACIPLPLRSMTINRAQAMRGVSSAY
jgi:hypothetical protein